MKLEPCASGNVQVLDADTDVWKVITEMAEAQGQEDAFYVCDLGDIVLKHREWKLKLPRVYPHYAVKCNDSRTVLELLAALGTGFDCASKTEIQKVLDIGVDPDRIIYANPVKQASHLRYAASRNVQTVTFDNEPELHKVKSLYPKAKLVIRIRCDDMKAQCPLGMKFGVLPKDAPYLLTVAHNLGLDVIGVSFHVGSGCKDPSVFYEAISASKWVFRTATEIGFNFTLLDIGGGYSGNKNSSLDEYAKVINKSLDKHFPDGCGIDVIAEPGRFYVCSAFTLATHIHARREMVMEDEEKSYMYYINDGVYGSFNCVLYDRATVQPLPLKCPLKEKLYQCSVWGPTCDGVDQVCDNVQLPDLDVGQWLVFEDMGAYTVSVGGTFNGFPLPKICYVVSEPVWFLLKEKFPFSEEDITAGMNPANRKTVGMSKTQDQLHTAIPLTTGSFGTLLASFHSEMLHISPLK